MPELPDVQGRKDDRGVPIDAVGITGVLIPMKVKDQENQHQHVVGNFALATNLKANQKGVHMSRFMEALEEVFNREVDLTYLHAGLLPRILDKQGASTGFISVCFEYFIEKKAPVSKIKSKLPVHCDFVVSTEHRPMLVVSVPVMSVCPCSLEMSEKGQAHNQRTYVTVQVEMKGFVWIESLVRDIEGCSSSPVYPLMKREDEKYVTDASHSKPMFVEDIVRELAAALQEYNPSLIGSYVIDAESHESIHAHNARATICGKVRDEEEEEQ